MRILCVSPIFPPRANAEAFCGGKMVLALKQLGAEIMVLCQRGFGNSSLPDDSGVWQSLRGDSLLIEDRPRGHRLAGALCAFQYQTPYWARWINDAVSAAVRAHQRSAFDLVYSRSLPWFSHIAGYWVSRRLKVPWIANLNDPWDLHLFPGDNAPAVSPLYARTARYWLRRTLASATAVTFPCSRLADYTLHQADMTARVRVIPHIGWTRPARHSSERFTLLHAGSLGPQELTRRSAHSLLAGLRGFLDRVPTAADSTRLVLVGTVDPNTDAAIDRLGLRRVVSMTGRVNYEASLEHIASASVCVLVEAKMAEGVFLPSKLADYLVAKKPVLALSPAIGTVADMASDPGILRVSADDEFAIEQAITKLYQAFLGRRLSDLSPLDRLTGQFQPDSITKQFLELAGCNEAPQMRSASPVAFVGH